MLRSRRSSGVNAAGLQRGLDVFKHGEPGKQRKALEDDGDVDLGLGDGLLVPVDLAGRGPREAGQHAQHGGFAGAGGTEQGENLARAQCSRSVAEMTWMRFSLGCA